MNFLGPEKLVENGLYHHDSTKKQLKNQFLKVALRKLKEENRKRQAHKVGRREMSRTSIDSQNH